MNKIYKIVFNRSTNTSIVTSELAKGRGKTSNTLAKGLVLTALGLAVTNAAHSATIVGKTTNTSNQNIETGWVTAEHGIAIGTGENDASGRAVVRSNKGVAIGYQAGTDGVSGLALGDHATTSNTNTIAIGTNAKSKYENGIAIGANSRTNDDTVAGSNDYSTDGIAIGNGAKTTIFGRGSKRANIVKFGRTKVAEGIAIGSKALATTGSIHIGNQDYKGAIAEYDLGANNKLQEALNVGATTLGDNSINRSHFSAVIGAYNSLSSIKQSSGFASFFDGSREASNSQGMGATILGTLNSMENLPSSNDADILKYSGISNSIVGTANKIKHSNGALIWGTGNEINRSLLNMNNYLNVEKDRSSVREFQDYLMEYSRTNRAGSVGVIGSDNQVNQTLFSTVFGVGNKVLSNTDVNESDLAARDNTSNSGESLSDDFRSKHMNSFLSVAGYENQLKDATRGVVMGVKNNAEYATDTLMFGNYHKLKGTQDNLAERNILLGFNYDNVNPEHHTDQPTKEQADVATSVKDTIGIGSDVKIGADRAIAMGKGSNAKGEDSIAIGTENLAGGTQTIAVGYKNSVKATHSGAFGDPNFIGTDTSNTTGTYAFGNNNGTVDKPIITNHTFILGSNVVTTADNSVALGKDTAITAGSADTTASLKAKVTDGTDGTTTTAGSTGTVNKANVNGVEYSGFAGSTSVGAVSVGASGLERRIQNVAAGEISSTSTDAINGSQLYAVADTLNKKMLTEDQVNTSINNAITNNGWKVSEDNGTKLKKIP